MAYILVLASITLMAISIWQHWWTKPKTQKNIYADFVHFRILEFIPLLAKMATDKYDILQYLSFSSLLLFPVIYSPCFYLLFPLFFASDNPNPAFILDDYRHFIQNKVFVYSHCVFCFISVCSEMVSRAKYVPHVS